MTRGRLLVACLAGVAGLAWMDPARDRLVEAHRLYDQGKYDEALTRYGEALVDDPDSAMLNFNMGTASYKAGKLTDALASFGRVQPDAKDPTRVARAAYNAGNAHYHLGAAAEATAPQDALNAYGEALAAYRRALAIDPNDRDSKFNYEFVSKRLDELQRKLAEQQQQQEDQQQQEQQDQPPQPQEQQQPEQQEQQPQPQPEASPDQQATASTPEQAPQPEETPGSSEPGAPPQPSDEDEVRQEPTPDQGTQPAAQESPGAPAAGAEAAESADSSRDRMSPDEAAALVDSAKQDEMEPGEFARQAQGATVAEPARDW